ncbi:MAG: TonB-dependent receptor, partial [Candidatus Fermentibacteraceae bacterium]|nr:TonB-dependent receptor [Candidatus Fermentibacteraceae bacterium]
SAGTTGYSGTFLLNGMMNAASYGMLASVSAGETESPQWTLPTDGARERGSLDGWARLTLGRFMLSSGIRAGRHRYRSTVPDLVDDTHDELGAHSGTEFRGKVAGLDIGISAQLLLNRVRSTSIGSRGTVELRTSLEAGYISGISATGSVALSAVPGSSTLTGAGIMLGMPFPDSVLLTHAGASLGYRRPTLNDLYWPEDSFALGNPDLGPETSVEAEAGISLHALRWTRVSVTGFAGESRNLIRWEPGPGGKWTPVNVARVLRRGIEAEAWAEAGSLEMSGTLTLLDVRDNDPGSVNYARTLPYVPDYTWALGAGIELPRRLEWNLGISGTGIRFMNYSETSWMPVYTVVSAGLSLRPAFLENVAVELSVDNLFDEEYLETSGFQGMGRVFHMGLRWKGK